MNTILPNVEHNIPTITQNPFYSIWGLSKNDISDVRVLHQHQQIGQLPSTLHDTK